MRVFFSLAVFLSAATLSVAADMPYETITKEKGIYALELAGLGFAFEDSDSTQKPLTFLIKVVSKVQELEEVETSQGTVPVRQEVIVKPSVIRLEYVSYSLEVVELSYNYLEADLYSTRVTELGEFSAGEKLGKIKLTLTDYTGLYGGKGRITIGKKNYSVFLYRREALEGFNNWIDELE